MRKSIVKKAKFDITDLNTIKVLHLIAIHLFLVDLSHLLNFGFWFEQVAKSCFVPVLLGHAIDDDFINPHHSDRIFEAYVVSTFSVFIDHLQFPRIKL